MVYDYIRLRVSALFEIHGREHGVGEREQKPARRHEYPLLCKGVEYHGGKAHGKGHEQQEGIYSDYCSELPEFQLHQLFADYDIADRDYDRRCYRQQNRERRPLAAGSENRADIEQMAYHERDEARVQKLIRIGFVYPLEVKPDIARETERKAEHDKHHIDPVTRICRRRAERRKQEEEARYRL